MIAANENENGEGADEYAELRSPFFKSTEHPVECFSFWFYFGVRFLNYLVKYQYLIIDELQVEGDSEGLIISTFDKQGKPNFVWLLADTWSDEAQWVQGRVEIKPEVVEQDSEYQVKICTISLFASMY